ncbi:hypothetical protein Hte_010129 [Hypoxylon texense]
MPDRMGPEREDIKDQIHVKRWRQSHEAISSGYKAPEKFFPIIIHPQNFISSPEKLQEFAELPSTPETFTTTTTSFNFTREPTGENEDEDEGQEVEICAVNREQYVRICRMSEYEKQLVWFQGEKRNAILVTRGRVTANKTNRPLQGRSHSLTGKFGFRTNERGR